MTNRAPHPVLTITGARLSFGDRVLWDELDLSVQRGEFIAVLGANGSGKSSLLRAILGEQPLDAGTITINGAPAGRGSRTVGYVPQRTALDGTTAIRGRDLVRLGLDGHRWGTGIVGSRRARDRVQELLRSVDAEAFADVPISQLSGGELQRIRIAEALAGNPTLLLCDEPLAALDIGQAQTVVGVLDAHRKAHGTALLFVTHDINAVLGAADRVLYLAGGRFRLGTPDEVLTSPSLTDLYGAPVDVFHTQGRVIVVAATDPGADHLAPHSDSPEDCEDPHGHQHLYSQQHALESERSVKA